VADFFKTSREAMRILEDTMTPFTIDVDADSDLQLLLDSYHVPAEARAEFVAGVQRSVSFLEALPGFRAHLAFEKVSGDSAFNIITIAVWQSREAVANAVGQVQAYYNRIGYDPRETVTRLGITADVGNYYAPIRAATSAAVAPRSADDSTERHP
jgi:hypothetical protein